MWSHYLDNLLLALMHFNTDKNRAGNNNWKHQSLLSDFWNTVLCYWFQINVSNIPEIDTPLFCLIKIPVCVKKPGSEGWPWDTLALSVSSSPPKKIFLMVPCTSTGFTSFIRHFSEKDTTNVLEETARNTVQNGETDIQATSYTQQSSA